MMVILTLSQLQMEVIYLVVIQNLMTEISSLGIMEDGTLGYLN